MPPLRNPGSRTMPRWMGWFIIAAVTILGLTSGVIAWVSIALGLWRLLILAC